MSIVLRHHRRANWRISFLFLSLLFFNPFSISAQEEPAPDGGAEAEAEVDYEAKGGQLFQLNCATCHRTDELGKTGPGLKGVRSRIPKGNWLYEWVWNSDKVKLTDPYAKKITEEWGGAAMTAFPNLTEQEIDGIIAWVAANPSWSADQSGGGGGSTAGDDVNPYQAYKSDPPSTINTELILWLVGLSVLLYIVIKTLGIVKTSLVMMTKREEEEEEDAETEDVSHGQGIINWINGHKRYAALIVLILVLAGAVDMWYRLVEVGVYQGYEPEQPIWFSHKIHAGTNEIACQYCHSSAEKGKSAGIPSVNICMNCHVAVPEGKYSGKEEIAKIYAAVGYDPDLPGGQYVPDAPTEPIKWVKVHNLPEFAYFNHSQHVVVGKQECQTCHGPVEEMHVLRQHSPLTMGWCINCHRETKLTIEEGNEYYQDIKEDLRLRHIELGLEEFTVAQGGGLECAKCHY